MGERFTAYEIFERDAWTCGICHGPVDKAVRFPDERSATLDHVVPLSRGGQHTRANVQAAHWGCNHAKGSTLPAVA
jgi:5-methylcytosine-specific restriction endonuclease McrA